MGLQMSFLESAVAGYSLMALDGHVGTVSDFLFDDVTWRVSWLVVRTGDWRSARLSLVKPGVIGLVDHERRLLHVNLTKAQVEACPDILMDEPVSRQIEYGEHGFEGWQPDWGNGRYVAGYWGGLGVHVPQARLDEERNDPKGARKPRPADPHLRSVSDMTGNQVAATNGESGHLRDVVIDQASWRIDGVIIETGALWFSRRVVLQPAAVKKISWSHQEVSLNITREAVRAAPAYAAG
jgi:sporulation protein YlmC with PRC-barrel domain